MAGRSQFTFYRSFYEAICSLPKKEQTGVLLAICAYALDEKEPAGLSAVGNAVFSLVRPTLDASKRCDCAETEKPPADAGTSVGGSEKNICAVIHFTASVHKNQAVKG